MARTKSAKLAAKRGRPRIPDLDRTPEGRIRRTNEQNSGRQEQKERQVKATVIEMRERVYGARANQDSPHWGYTLGRIYLDGRLGTVATDKEKIGLAEMRLEAGNRYATEMSRYYSLTGIPFPSPRAQSLFAVHGYDGDVSEERAKSARDAANRMMLLEGALLGQGMGRQIATTVKNICVLDIEEARNWPSHMFNLLKIGLDSLVFFYGLEQERQIS